MAVVDVQTGYDCGWWAPGDGEPGEEWAFTAAELRLSWDGPGESIDVQVMTPDGPRALAAVPVAGVAAVMVKVLGEAG